VGLLKLDDGLDRLELNQIAVFHGDVNSLVVRARAYRDDDGLCLFELDELRVAGFGVSQCPSLEAAIP
jgi:hypothetical protein